MTTPNPQTAIPGYTYGTPAVGRSPLTLDDLAKLKTSLLFGADDERALRQAGEVLADQVDAVLDLWYGFVGSHPHLVHYFTDGRGNADTAYLAAVRQRFGQWILDTCNRPYDQTWLDWQHEIALRHHRSKKNHTDGAQAVANVDARYLVAFIVPITATMKPFLGQKGHSAAEVEAMHAAWFKAVTLQVALWLAPYIAADDY